jgi:phosphate transport system ATP-binding protein
MVNWVERRDMDAEVKLSCKNLSFYFSEDKWVLRDIDLDIYDREILAIFGPADSGRTTFLRILNRLVDLVEGSHVEGQVLLDGEDIYAPDVDVIQLRRRVGMLFAEPLPLPGSIFDNIAYGPILTGIRKKATLEDIVQVSLEKAALWPEVKDRLDEPAMTLSGGQQQRLCLARTLALEPEVILLDAPTSGLDPVSTAKVEASLQELKTQYAIVIVPHSVQQAARVADKAAFFLAGELIEYGSGEEIFTRPEDARTSDYVTGRFG